MKNYSESFTKVVAFVLAIMLLSLTCPYAYAAEDDKLPGLNVLESPKPESVASDANTSDTNTSDTTSVSQPNSQADSLLSSPKPDAAEPEKAADAGQSDKETTKEDSHAYTLGPGDVLTITDYGLRGDADFTSQTVPVLPDGTVNVYPVGIMKASGITLRKFNEVLNDQAKEFIIEPQYVVTIAQPRPVSIYVLGEIANPGVYTFGEATGVSEAGYGGMGGGGMGRRITGPRSQQGQRGKLSPDIATTGQLLGAVYGAKFAAWAPKWGTVGGLAAYGMSKMGKNNDDASASSGLPPIAQPFVMPGAGSPARNLSTLSGGYGSMQGNYGSLSFGDAAGGVNPVIPGMNPTGGGGAGNPMGNLSGGGRGGASDMMIPAQAAVNVTNITLMTAIERAGGLRETANVRRIQIRRANGKDVITADLWKLVSEGDTTQDIALQPGDTVFIPQGGSDFNPEGLGMMASFKGRWVRVLGAVKAPGLVELRPNDDIYSVIARAGGFATGAATRSVTLSRMNRDGTVFAKRISLVRGLKDREALARLPVQTGDVVMVSTSLIKTVGQEVLRAGMITGLAMVVIYFSNKVHNVNVVTNEEGTPTNNARVAVF